MNGNRSRKQQNILADWAPCLLLKQINVSCRTWTEALDEAHTRLCSGRQTSRLPFSILRLANTLEKKNTINDQLNIKFQLTLMFQLNSYHVLTI